MLRRITIRLELVFARIEAGQRMQQEDELRHDDEKQYQRHGGRLHIHVESRIKPALIHELREQPQETQTGRKNPRNSFHDMPQFEMPELMRQYRLNFTRHEPRKQRIEKDDALGLAETGEVRVAV